MPGALSSAPDDNPLLGLSSTRDPRDRERESGVILPSPAETSQAASPGTRDGGMSDIIGTLMMVSITIVMAVGFQAYISGATPTTQEHTFVDLSGRVMQGADGWGSGDEILRVTHNGGDPLPETSTSIRITVGTTTVIYTGQALGSSFTDGTFTIGERWESPGGDLTIDHGETVFVEVVTGGQTQEVAASLELDARGTTP